MYLEPCRGGFLHLSNRTKICTHGIASHGGGGEVDWSLVGEWKEVSEVEGLNWRLVWRGPGEARLALRYLPLRIGFRLHVLLPNHVGSRVIVHLR